MALGRPAALALALLALTADAALRRKEEDSRLPQTVTRYAEQAAAQREEAQSFLHAAQELQDRAESFLPEEGRAAEMELPGEERPVLAVRGQYPVHHRLAAARAALHHHAMTAAAESPYSSDVYAALHPALPASYGSYPYSTYLPSGHQLALRRAHLRHAALHAAALHHSLGYHRSLMHHHLAEQATSKTRMLRNLAARAAARHSATVNMAVENAAAAYRTQVRAAEMHAHRLRCRARRDAHARVLAVKAAACAVKEAKAAVLKARRSARIAAQASHATAVLTRHRRACMLRAMAKVRSLKRAISALHKAADHSARRAACHRTHAIHHEVHADLMHDAALQNLYSGYQPGYY